MGCPKTLLYVPAGVYALLSDRQTIFYFIFSIFGPPEHHTGIIINVGSLSHLFWKMYGNCFYVNKKKKVAHFNRLSLHQYCKPQSSYWHWCHLIFDNPLTQRDKHIFQPSVLKYSPFFSPPGWTALILSYQPLCFALSLSKLLLLLGRNTSHLCWSSLHWSPVTFGADFRTLLLILLLIWAFLTCLEFWTFHTPRKSTELMSAGLTLFTVPAEESLQ